MNQMVLLSTLMHLLFFSIFWLTPFFKVKREVYTPVYTVNLVRMPVQESPPARKAKPVRKVKPVNLLSGKKKSDALAQLKAFEKNIEKEKKLDSKDLEESDLAEMMAALDKVTTMESESGLLDDSKKKNEKILEDLAKLEKEWSKDKDVLEGLEKLKKSESLKKLEELEKKWSEEKLSEAKLAGQTASISSQNINESPSYLSSYYLLVTSKAKSHWKDPSGAEILNEKETNKKAIILFNIIRNGTIEDAKINQSSGNRTLDDLALTAVKKSDPLPPLPSEYHGAFLRVFLGFDYSLK